MSDEFTESIFEELLYKIKTNWETISFPEYQKQSNVCLLRHDIDMSVHRANKLCKIEEHSGIRATYFIWLHSPLYNFYEKEIMHLLIDIKNRNHLFGLHFDPDFYGDEINKSNFEQYLIYEKELIEQALDVKVSAFSFHNPDMGNWLDCNNDEVAGIINAYGRTFQKKFMYCSDSNGIWRHKNLFALLDDKSNRYLHILLHPEWWTPEPMSPRARVSRCINGRAAKQHTNYDVTMRASGRLNIGMP
jgi:hypothetical protein